MTQNRGRSDQDTDRLLVVDRLFSNLRQLRPRHLARWIIRPVAVEADDAPLDPPARADQAGVLGDGVMDHVSTAVGDFDDAAAETAWNGRRGPRAEGGLAHLLEIENAQIGRPVLVFLLVEARGDAQQRVAVVARRQLALVLRAGEIEVELEPVGGAGGSCRSGPATWSPCTSPCSCRTCRALARASSPKLLCRVSFAGPPGCIAS